MILSITGPSASGKSTLMRGISAARPGARLLESVTTRDKRASDIPGEYKYIPQSWFDTFLRDNVLAWHDEAYGNWYGTRRETVERALESELCVGALTFKGVRGLIAYAERAHKRDQVRSIYLRVGDPEKLRQRLIHRGDALKDVERRVADCRDWDVQAESSGLPFRFINSTLPKEDVLAQALAFLDQPAS